MYCSVPTLESIGRRQKTVRYKWSIMNIDILERNPNPCANEMSTPILKMLLSESENKDKFQKKGTPYRFKRFRVRFELHVEMMKSVSFFYFAGKGILHVKSIWKYITFNPIRCFIFLRQGLSRLKNRVVRRTGTSDEFPHLIEESN